MGRIIAWFVDNPIAANLLMVITLLMGLYTFPVVPKQFFPERELNLITVGVVYPGAGPSEVEQQICTRIEEAVDDLQGRDRIFSVASEGYGEVTIEVADNYDSLRLLNEIKSRVDGITSFPVEAERPQIVEKLWQSRILNIAVFGAIGEAALKALGEQLRDELSALPEVQQVNLAETRRDELGIEVAELELRRYGLRFNDVVGAVRGASIDLPAGKLITNDGDIQIKTRGQAYNAADFADIVVLEGEDGSRILLGDVATVVDGFEEVDREADFNGRPFVSLQILGDADSDILKTSSAVYAYLDGLATRLPEGIDIAVWRDMSVSFRERLNTLLYNGLGGLALVFVVLMLFLRPLLAAWVCVGIAVAFLGAIWLLPLAGGTLTVISLFAFILILGIVVDDAIIVGESIYAHQARGLPGPEAAVQGTRAVVKPVWFAVITTMLFFGTFFLLPGEAPEAHQIATVVVLALMFSLIESLLILPTHLAHMKPERPRGDGLLSRLELLREKFAASMEYAAERLYVPFLRRAMAAKYLTVLSFLMALSVVLSVYLGGWMASSFFPVVTSDFLTATVTLYEGGPISDATRIKARIDSAARRLQRELAEETGDEMIRYLRSVATKDAVIVSLGLSRGERRAISNGELKRRWQAYIGELPLVKDFDILHTIGHAGKDISLLMTADDLPTLREAAGAVKEALARYPGVYNVRDSLEYPRTEIELTLKPLAGTLGIELAELGRQVRRGFYGEEVQRIPRLREDVRVMVRYPRAERDAEEFLQNMRIRLPDGAEVPFDAVAEVSYVPGYPKIERIERRRISEVSAELEPGHAAPPIIAAVMSEHLPAWRQQFPGFEIGLDGLQLDRSEFLARMKRLMIGASLLVFGLMAILFRSWWQPVLILIAVPFGYMGAIIGHLLFGREMSMFSLLGIIACAGVVINDNLVLIVRVNDLRERGMALWDALLRGGRDRFRPILLTSVTTFAGLLPIVLETSVQAQFLIPMVLSLTFGVLLATGVTLVFVPCLYLVLDGLLRRLTLGWFGSNDQSAGPPQRQTGA